MSESPLNVLLVTKGHPFQKEPFFSVFDRNPEIIYTHVEQPAAQALFRPGAVDAYDAIVLYDMPGIQFRGDGTGLDAIEPSEEYKEGLLALLEQGKGMFFMHHAMCGWPSWEEYAEIIGGRFLYEPGTLRGKAVPPSGYQLNAKHQVSPVSEHPIAAGIEPFEIIDEVYLAEIFEDDVQPVLRTDFPIVRERFFDPSQAIRGAMDQREGWEHEPGSDLIAWVKSYKNSPIAYFLCGDCPSAYKNAGFQQVVANAIRWVASSEAHEWARAGGVKSGR